MFNRIVSLVCAAAFVYACVRGPIVIESETIVTATDMETRSQAIGELVQAMRAGEITIVSK